MSYEIAIGRIVVHGDAGVIGEREAFAASLERTVRERLGTDAPAGTGGRAAEAVRDAIATALLRAATGRRP